jgi:uncharacterized protein (TIGR00297 family)
MMNLWVLSLLLAGVIASIYTKKLTIPAALTGGILGWLTYAGGGYIGLEMLAAFFVLGTAATSYNAAEKRLLKTNDSHQTRRTTGQVIANGGVAALAGLAILLFPSVKPILLAAMAGSLASATADTLSSELGIIYGRRFFNILTGRRDEKGLDGVISLEGTLIGLGGSAIIGLLYITTNHPTGGFWIILLAGTLGNLADSFLGASLERKGFIGNNTVNFLNTLLAAIVAGFLI